VKSVVEYHHLDSIKKYNLGREVVLLYHKIATECSQALLLLLIKIGIHYCGCSPSQFCNKKCFNSSDCIPLVNFFSYIPLSLVNHRIWENNNRKTWLHGFLKQLR